MEIRQVGIIGHGFVGKILKRYFPEAKISDRDSDSRTIAEVLSSDIIFVAVNFPDNCLSKESKDQLERYFSVLTDKIIVIKSTFIPGTTDYFQAKYPRLRFAYNPE